MVVVRSTGLIPDPWLEPIRQVEGFLFTVSLVGVGFGVDLGRLRKLGEDPWHWAWPPGFWWPACPTSA